jgi:hypothetical protein
MSAITLIKETGKAEGDHPAMLVIRFMGISR